MRFRSRGQNRDEKLLRSARRATLLIAGGAVLLLLWNLSGSGNSLNTALIQTGAVTGAAGTVRRDPSRLLADEVQVVTDTSGASSGNPAAFIDKAGAAAMEARTEAPVGLDDAPESLTRTVRDDVLGVLSEENDAMLGMLRLSEKVLRDRLHEMPEARYAVMMDSPEACRGKPFTVHGRLRRLTRAQLPRSANRYGIKSAWEAWISTADSGNQLIHVLALSTGPGLPVTQATGKEAPEVELAGYFFKREGYAAKGRDGTGALALAPLIIADRIQRTVPRIVTTRADELNPWLTWIAATICLAVVALIWRFQQADHQFRGTRTHQFTQPPVRPSFEGISSISVKEVLHEMEQQARNGVPDTSLTLPQ